MKKKKKKKKQYSINKYGALDVRLFPKKIMRIYLTH